MNIKKIIREEVDDLQWMDDIESPVYEGMLFYYYEDKENLYKVLKLTDEYDAIIGRPSDNEPKEHHLKYPINKVEEHIEKGTWIVYNK